MEVHKTGSDGWNNCRTTHLTSGKRRTDRETIETEKHKLEEEKKKKKESWSPCFSNSHDLMTRPQATEAVCGWM